MPYADPEKKKERYKKWRLENKERVKKVNKEWRIKNKERHDKSALNWRERNREKIRAYSKLNRYVLKGRFARWKEGAKNRNLQWDDSITLEYINSLPMVCHYTKIELTLEPYKENTISLDRVDSSKGYTKDNIVLCCWAVNAMKQALQKDRFIELCKIIAANN